MLALKPSCEHCDINLPNGDQRAMICSYECTFCTDCVDQVLDGICPNCGGTFVPRPVRVDREWKDGVSVSHHPASDQRVHKPVDVSAHKKFAADVKKKMSQSQQS